MRLKSRQDLEVLTEAQFINFLIALLGPFVTAVDILTYSFFHLHSRVLVSE